MRIDGWKSIAVYLGRERTTAMRWAAERGMPVHRIPGAGRGSVFALSDEIDAWLKAGGDAGAGAGAGVGVDQPGEGAGNVPVSTAPDSSIFTRVRALKLRYLAPVGFAGLALGAYAYTQPGAEQPRAELPANAALAALYLDARGDWAERSGASIEQAIAKLQRVVEREPGFAPAYAALADCYVLAREFGSLGDAEAFARAQAAADAALRIDPENAAALRADGFLHYWWRNDGVAAKASFERSMALGPGDAQSHFWYGNILIDNGDFAEGLAQLDRARLLEPASLALQADIAWARWSAGQEAEARSSLEDLRDRNPQLATIRDYLAVIYLADGSIPAFVKEARALADIRQDAGSLREAELLEASLPRGSEAVLNLLLAETMGEFQRGDRTQLVWPIYVASMAGSKAQVRRLLDMAQARNEHWGSAGLLRQVAKRWQDDSQISAMLEMRRNPSLLLAASQGARTRPAG
ncbi:hypothetical protein GCM10009127_13130 [Alteraurantiacibacter aestuarii]|uniref:Tetratricopeptide repeat protein n=1 Tax=Alteraurantiacibacter aestuarii TaxID=650004 RepID=A0A844ZMM6_9SPHN|nr:tetratricopeptide repeat protein [Alteraurantiacibacter aestuarii]MXO88097.1 tetratricopeptide repeat protein [Alteraurantiacibacter aestuarii]